MTKTSFEELLRFHDRLVANDIEYLELKKPNSGFMLVDIWARYEWSEEFNYQTIVDYFAIWGFAFDPRWNSFAMTNIRSMQLADPDGYRGFRSKMRKL